MKTLIEGALKNRVAANLFALIIILSGFIMAQTLTMRLFPNLVLQAISIAVPYPGATPTEVETSIVKPIEERLEGLEGVRKITALAGTGVASIIVDLEEGESITEMLDDIQTEIDRITIFPQDAEEPQITHVETEELAARLVIFGDVDLGTLKKTAERIRSDLTEKDGLSRANIGGAPPYLINVAINQATLESLGLSLVDIANRVRDESVDLSGGEIEGERQKLLVRSIGERRSGEEFSDVVISSGATGTPVTLTDIATVTDSLSESPVFSSYKGQPAAYVSVLRTGNEKLLELAGIVVSYIENDLQAVLPPGVKAELWRNESTNLQDRIDLLSKNAKLGLLLVATLLMAFLDIRIAFWVCFGVTISFVGSFALMAFYDVTINQLSLFGFILAIGIVVDDAIVVGENIHGTWRKQRGSAKEAARVGVLRVSTPVLFSVSTTIVAFVPLLILPGTFGQFMAPIASVVIFVLMISLFDSFFILPHHLSNLSNRPPRWFSPRRIADPFRNWFASRLRRFIDGPLRRVVTFTVNNPLATLMVALGIFFLSMTAITSGTVRFVFFPSVEGDYVTAELELSENSSQAETRILAEQISAAAERTAAQVAEEGVLVGVLWSLGQSLALEDGEATPTGGAASNKAFIIARMVPAAERDLSALDFMAQWRKETGPLAGAQKLTFTADLVAPGAPIQLEVSTRNVDATKEVVALIAQELRSLPGVFDVTDDRVRTTDEVQIAIKPLARSYGLDQRRLAQQIRAAFFGAEATRVQRDREEIQVRIRLPKEERETLAAMRSLRLKVGDSFIPVEQLADLSIAPAPATISRINGRRVYTVSGYVETSVITAGEATDYITNVVAPRLAPDYDGLKITLSGTQEEQAKTAPAILRYFGMALVVIFTLLALNFKSYTQPLIVMCAIPFGFMGAVLGHALLGMNLTLLSFFGVIGLSGVIINNSLMVISFMNDRLKDGDSFETAVIESMLERFRAILLTTLTTFLGVTPIIAETSVQAQFLVPTAVSLGFGIIIGTSMLTLTLPALAILHTRMTKLWVPTLAYRMGLGNAPEPEPRGDDKPAKDPNNPAVVYKAAE